MNEKIFLLRKKLNMTQEAFGQRLGVRKTAISKLEKGENNLTEPMLKLICSEFNVNEEWLRTGEGIMFNESDTFSLDDYAKQRDMSDIDLKIIKGFLDLDPEVRKVILSTFKNALSDDRIEVAQKVDSIVGFIDEQEKNDKNKKSPVYEIEDLSSPRVAESEVNYKPDIDIDAELAGYRRQLEAERQNKRSLVLPDSNLG